MNILFKFAMAVALLFAVNMNADAQFGKLKGIADKAKNTTKKVEKAENKSSDAVSKAAKATMSPEQAEQLLAEKENYWLDEQGQTLKDMRQQQKQQENFDKIKAKLQKEVKPVKRNGGICFNFGDTANRWFPTNYLTGTVLQWSRQSFVFTTPADTNTAKYHNGRTVVPYVRPRIIGATGTVWFDDITLEEVRK